MALLTLLKNFIACSGQCTSE